LGIVLQGNFGGALKGNVQSGMKCTGGNVLDPSCTLPDGQAKNVDLVIAETQRRLRLRETEQTVSCAKHVFLFLSEKAMKIYVSFPNPWDRCL